LRSSSSAVSYWPACGRAPPPPPRRRRPISTSRRLPPATSPPPPLPRTWRSSPGSSSWR